MPNNTFTLNLWYRHSKAKFGVTCIPVGPPYTRLRAHLTHTNSLNTPNEREARGPREYPSPPSLYSTPPSCNNNLTNSRQNPASMGLASGIHCRRSTEDLYRAGIDHIEKEDAPYWPAEVVGGRRKLKAVRVTLAALTQRVVACTTLITTYPVGHLRRRRGSLA